MSAVLFGLCLLSTFGSHCLDQNDIQTQTVRGSETEKAKFSSKTIYNNISGTTTLTTKTDWVSCEATNTKTELG